MVLIMGVALAACGQTDPTPTSTAATQTSLVTSTPAGTATLAASPTPIKQSAILVTPDGADTELAAAVKGVMASLAAASGLEFSAVSKLSGSDIDSSTRVVVVMAPDPGVAGLAKDAPQTQFVAIGIENVQAGDNLSVIGPQGNRLDQQAFIAGYLAAVVTDDFRVGVLTLAGQDSSAIQNAFINGVSFFCGLCRPAYAPFVGYPQTGEITTPGDSASWQPVVDTMLKGTVTTVYVSPACSSPELLDYLVQAGAQVIGGVTPSDNLGSEWVATILPDPASALTQLWPDVMEGKGGEQMAMPLAVIDTSSGLLNTARLRLVDSTLQDLVAGYIEPNTVSVP